MAKDNDGLYISAGLDITPTLKNIENDIKTLNAQLKADNNARARIVAGLDLNKTQQLIQANLNNIINKLKLDISNIKVDINTNNVEQNINKTFENIANNANQTNTAIKEINSSLADLKVKSAITPVIDDKNVIQAQATIDKFKETFKELGTIDVVGTYKGVQSKSHLDKVVVSITDSVGAVRTLNYELNETEKIFQHISGDRFSDSGTTKLVGQIDEARSKYTALLEQWKSSNSWLETGLADKVKTVSDAIENLGSVDSLNILKQAFKDLETATARITKNLDTTHSSFNKVNNAKNEYAKMETTIKELGNSFDLLKSKPDELQKTISGLLGELNDLKAAESKTGITEDWSKKYQNLAISIRNAQNQVKLLHQEEKADNSEAQQQAHYYNKMFAEMLEIHKLRKQLVTAGAEETREIQRQITNLNKKVKYDEEQIAKKKLVNAELELEKNTLADIYEKQERINQAKISDKTNSVSIKADTKAISDAIKYEAQLKAQVADWEKLGLIFTEIKPSITALQDGIRNINSANDLKTWLHNLGVVENKVNAVKERLDVWVEAERNVLSIQTEIAKTDSVKQQPKYESLIQELTKAQQELENVRASSQRWLNDSIPQEQQQKYIIEQTADAQKKLNEALNNAKGKMNYGLNTIPDDIKKIDIALSKLNTIPTDLQQKFQGIKTAFEAIGKMDTSTNNGVQAKIVAYDKLQQSINEVTKALGIQRSQESANSYTQKEAANAEILSQRIKKLTSDIIAYKNANSKAMSSNKLSSNGITYAQELDGLLVKLKECSDPKEYQKIAANFRTVQSEIKSVGLAGNNLITTIKEAVLKFGSWMTVTHLISLSWRELKQLVSNVVDLDSAMSNLYKTTDETSTRYIKFFDEASQKAKKLKIDLADLIEQTAEWTKRGYNLDEASLLSESSGIYSVVGEIDNATAVQDLTTVLKSYNMTVEESIDIVDKFNNISNKYSVTAADIGEGLSNSITSLAVAGNSLDESISMLTTITEITGDASEAGNTLKVLSMRLRGAKLDIENMGESTDGMAESTSKLQEKIKALTNVNGTGGFDIMADANNFKPTYEIMQGIASVWKDMSDVDQANVCLYAQKCA